MRNLKRVVVTGISAITPLGNTVTDFWTSLVSGKSGAAPISRFDPSLFKTQFACEVKGFNPLNYFEKNEARKMDVFTQFAIAAAQDCIADSGLDLSAIDKTMAGVIWSTGIGGLQTFEEELISFLKNNNTPRFSPFFITKMIPNIASGLISIRNGFQGPSFTAVSACASSNTAIAMALDQIRLGRANIIVAGGSEASITQAAIGGFNSMKALSERNETPETASRPFDATRDGFVMGEGGSAIIFEELEHALSRGANIYAEIVGCASASDAYHITATHPEGLGAQIAMKRALDDANIGPEVIDYINAHGTSTPVGDISECKAIESVFASSLNKLHVSATKSMTGHLLGAAGSTEAIACILAIKNGIIPPTINLNERDSQINPAINLTPNVAVKKEVNYAMNNTFGFGGHIAVSIFKKYQ